MNYGNEASVYDLKYLAHPHGSYVTQAFLGTRPPSLLEQDSQSLDPSSYVVQRHRLLNQLDREQDHDIVFTVTNDHIVRIWASYESDGHSRVKQWAALDLGNVFVGEPTMAVVIIEPQWLDGAQTHPARQTTREIVLILALSASGLAKFLVASNVYCSPPNAILFTHKPEMDMRLPASAFPQNAYRSMTLPETFELTKGIIDTALFYIKTQCPISILSLSYRLESDATLSLLIHDRAKGTLRCIDFDVAPENSGNRFVLRDKFQGQTQPVRKIVRSNAVPSAANIILSILDSPHHNYVWEPLNLQGRITITKRFRVDIFCEEYPDNAIVDAVVLNDIGHSVANERRHLLLVWEKAHRLSLWDCNGANAFSMPALLVSQISLDQLLVLRQIAAIRVEAQYYIVAVLGDWSVLAWSLETEPKSNSFSLATSNVDPISYEYSPFTMGSIGDTIYATEFSFISEDGYVENYKPYFEGGRIKWAIQNKISTDICKARSIEGAGHLHKVGIVSSNGEAFSVWDSKTGVLEYEESACTEYGPISKINWTLVSTNSSAFIVVSYKSFVLLYTQLRYDYTNRVPTFAAIEQINLGGYTPHHISDVVWLNGTHLAIASGNQFFIDDHWVQLRAENGLNNTVTSNIRQLCLGYFPESHDKDLVLDMDDLARILNGPLPLYHPQFLVQALFMNQLLVVELILVTLFRKMSKGSPIAWDLGLDMAKILVTQTGLSDHKPQDVDDTKSIDVFSRFTEDLAQLLAQELAKVTLPLLTRHQQLTLIATVSLVLKLKRELASLDKNGSRFLIGCELSRRSAQPKLTMRDVNWALHSDNREALLAIAQDIVQRRLTWTAARNLHLAFWVKSQRLVGLVEEIARVEFAAARDPSGLTTLLYLALDKKQVLIGLWRSSSHADLQKMQTFFAHDFSQERWRTAALKNAYVLMGKHRYFDAASFFLLGGLVSDACAIIATKLNDVDLAILVCKVRGTGPSNANPELRKVIANHILPRAIENGDRWITSWAFWLVNEKECSIEALIKTPHAMINQHDGVFPNNSIKTIVPSHVGLNFLQDDPVLILLFGDLRHRNEKYMSGSLHIKPVEESQSLLRACTIYTRMGCDYLAVALLRNWKFVIPDFSSNVELAGVKSHAESQSGSEWGHTPKIVKTPAATFEEPDFSAFEFGF